jgi:hypothetical protein
MSFLLMPLQFLDGLRAQQMRQLLGGKPVCDLLHPLRGPTGKKMGDDRLLGLPVGIELQGIGH